jgi:homoisocitrate dehydrogenase
VALRKHLDTFANLRPAKGWLTPNDLDLLVVRENTEGLYVGQERHQTGANGSQQVITERLITQAGTARVARLAFAIAATEGRKLTVVHKANVIRQGDGLWRSTCLALQADFPDITVDEGLVDSVAYHMVRHPEKYQLLLCPNLYGDILSDLASGLADGLGMAPSLSIGNRAAIAEPVHGSAPDIAGQGIANPIAAILSAALLCRYRWQRLDLATIIEQAVAQVLQQGLRTPDLVIEPEQPTVDTVTITEAILQALTGFSL